MCFKKGVTEIPQPDASPNKTSQWTLYVDRASKQTGADIGLQLTSPTGERVEQAERLGFSATNNESEYKVTMGADNLSIQSDSQLVVGQVNAKFESRDPRMTKYASLVKKKLNTLSTWILKHVPPGP